MHLQRNVFSKSKYYLRISRAADLKNRQERILFRFFEILPGFLTWLTIIAAVCLSFFKPFWVAIFAIAFVLYWFLKALYFSFHMRMGYRKMRASQKINWPALLQELKNFPQDLLINSWQDIYHLVVLPIYKEPYQVIRESLKSILKTDYPKKNLIVILSQEVRAGEEINQPMAQKISQEFKEKFFKFLITRHPADLPGEIAAKSSNETWAAKKGKELLDNLGIAYERVIFSSFDADTIVSTNYFSCLTFSYLTTPKPTRTSFQPIPLFLNNVWQVPVISRLFSFSTTFWHIINQERPEKLITFSSHSMSFKALVEVGFKQTDVVSDDSRIFWQCLLYYDGDYRVQPLYVSISMDANAAKTIFQTYAQIYRQQRRWAYGVGDIAYFLFGFSKNKKISLRKKISLSFELIEGHWGWACASLLLFFLGWLPSLVGGSEFSQTLFSYNLPRMTSRILTIAMLGLFTFIYYTFYLLPPKPGSRKKGLNVFWASLQWFLLPLTMVFFTSLPAIDAQTRWLLGKYMGFWPTPKYRK